MIESGVTIAIVAVAVFFVGRRFLRARKGDAGCGCGRGRDCGGPCGKGRRGA